MGVIQDKLKPIFNYLISIEWNIEKEWLELIIGLPKEWEYKENKSIKCESFDETDVGRYMRLSPKNETVVVDDLVDYVEIIIKVNNEIEQKQKEFAKEMEEMKLAFQQKITDFYDTLDQEKKKSFELIINDVDEKKQQKPTSRGTTKKSEKTTGIVSETTI